MPGLFSTIIRLGLYLIDHDKAYIDQQSSDAIAEQKVRLQ